MAEEQSQGSDEGASADRIKGEGPADQEAKAGDAGNTRGKAAAARRKTLQLAMALLGFVVGCVAGTYGEELLVRANPGFFGPDNQQIIEDQQANFAALEEKLAALKRTAGDDPEAAAMIGELDSLIQQQKALAQRKDDMFKATDVANQALKDQMLQERGTTGAVDFWVGLGESVVLREPGTAVSVIKYWSSTDQADVNLSGQKTRMHVGDTLAVPTSQGEYTLVYRQAKRASDGRLGFDLAGPKP